MGFDPMILISLFYAVIGVRVVVQIARNWRSTWDSRFTQSDRVLVDQASFFVLVPISVILHELGHAVTIWSFGGSVVEYGFYGFAGYVSFDPRGFSDWQLILVASAGSFVNLLLVLLALGLVFARRPRMRAAFNELLIQFAFISGINAFIVYPVLDLLSGIQGGDWHQMYDGGVPALSAVIGVIHVAVLVSGYWLFTNPRMKARMASLTDVPPGFERAPMGGIRPGKIDLTTLNPAEALLHDAGERVASGWPTRVQRTIQRFNGGTALILEWSSGSRVHAIAARTFANGSTDLVAIPIIPGRTTPQPPRTLHRWMTRPDVSSLTMGMRVAMETIEREGI